MKKKLGEHNRMKRISSIILGLVLVISTISLGCSTSYVPMKIEGMAMLPSFKDGDRIIIEIDYSKIKRGDVIVFYAKTDKEKVNFKRVVGLPGETLSIIDGDVLIDGKKIEEPYIDQQFNQVKDNRLPVSVPDRSYFVLGDNRDNSADSRIWGVVPEDLIIGRQTLTY